MATWIDFKELRERVRIADVLRQHNVQLKVRGETATGLCPLPTHPGRTDGSKRSPSFSVHLGKGVWHCFGCGAKGNSIDLYSRLLGLDPDDPAQFRRAALQLAESLGIECKRPTRQNGATATNGVRSEPAARSTPARPSAKAVPSPPPQVPSAAPAEPPARVVVNEPMNFELKQIDPHHPYLAARGLTPETIAYFGLGFCGRGMMKDRIAIPIHDPLGRLVGYAGRLVDDEQRDPEHPKYLFPGTREREGVQYVFRKSELVYNLHRLGDSLANLIVVEGFPAAWWLHQNGYADTVALMGSHCSAEQARLIAERVCDGGRIWLLPDGNGAGAQMAAQALPLLASHHFTRLVTLEKGRQPTDCDPGELAQLLGATKSGTSEKPHVANVSGTSNEKASSPMAAERHPSRSSN